MRHAHTVAQVRAAEEASPELASGVLMQRAARGLAHEVIALVGGGYGRRVALLVGSGDNGGDALYAGAYLARRGALVDAWLLADQVHEEGLAAFRAAGGRVATRGGSGAHPLRADHAAGVDVVIDGIVGIGGRPGLRDGALEACRVLGVPVGATGGHSPDDRWPPGTRGVRGRPWVLSVDLPSGIDADTGRVEGAHVQADLTVTFGTEKVAHLVDPAAAACGTVRLVDIGLDLPRAGVEALERADVRSLLPVPVGADHKYTRGVVGVRAGSATYPGAALLCVAGASAGLAGMVRFRAVDGDEATARRVVDAHPEVVVPAGSTDAGRVQAWVVGSGGGERAAGALAEATADGVPVVVDADALAALDGPLPVPGVLTPHAGELARLLGLTREEVEAGQLDAVRRAADRFEAVVVLKGRRTLVAEPRGRVRVNTTGTPWLGTAGAGDVLAGVMGSLLAAGLPAFDAASVGCWLHGDAATTASAGGPLTASTVAGALSAAVRRVLLTP